MWTKEQGMTVLNHPRSFSFHRCRADHSSWPCCYCANDSLRSEDDFAKWRGLSTAGTWKFGVPLLRLRSLMEPRPWNHWGPTVALTLVGLDVSNGEVERVLCDCVDHPMLVMVAQGPVIVGLSGLFDQVHPGICGVPWGVAKRLLFLFLGKTSSMWK
jgi:hypothetical protein